MSNAAKKVLKMMEDNNWSFYDLESKIIEGHFNDELKEGAIELIEIWRG